MKLIVRKSLKKGLTCAKCQRKLASIRIVDGSPRALYCSVCDLAYVHFQFYKQGKYPNIEIENESEIDTMGYFCKNPMTKKKVKEILKNDISEKDIILNRMKMLAKVRYPKIVIKTTKYYNSRITKLGYIPNHYKADYVVNNITRPFQGGAVNPR